MNADASAVLASATIARVLKDGTIRLQCDVSPEYREIVSAWLEPDLPVAIARVSRHAAATEMVERGASAPFSPSHENGGAAVGNYGEAARELRLSGFFRAPDVWSAIGTDAAYQQWCREQPCAKCGRDGSESNPIVYAHVRRIADGAGTGIKPKFAGIPLHDSEHREQHQKGESALGGKEWFDKERIAHVQEWAWQAIKVQLGAASMRDVAPAKLLAWAQRAGVEQYLPACYREA